MKFERKEDWLNLFANDDFRYNEGLWRPNVCPELMRICVLIPKPGQQVIVQLHCNGLPVATQLLPKRWSRTQKQIDAFVEAVQIMDDKERDNK